MRRRSRITLVTAAAALVLPVSSALATTAADRHQWLDIVPSQRAAPPGGDLRIIVFRGAPAAEREGATRGAAASTAATTKQNRELAAVKRAGVQLQVQGRFVRVIDAVVARVRPADLAALAALGPVQGVYPVRALAPTALSETAVPELGAEARPLQPTPGGDGAGASVAILDGPIDPTASYLGGRVTVTAGLQSGAGVGAGAEHGTALAGIVTGSNGPGKLSGVAPASTVLSIPIFDVGAGGALTGTDADLLAGLERAADPNGDGNLSDRVRVALVAAGSPYASFASTPVDEATNDLARLGTVVVAAAGNDGPTGTARGSVAAPASGPSVLAVGATDGRAVTLATPVTINGGETSLGGSLALLDTIAPPPGTTLPIRLSGENVAGAAVLLQRGTSLRSAARLAAAAGAAAVIAWGDESGPSGALGIDDAAPLPVLALDSATAAALSQQLAAGKQPTVAFGATTSAPNRARGTVAAFSSSGLTDDARLKPDLVAPGVGIVSSTGAGTYASFSGTSIAAAQVAGLAAGLAGRHPDWSADRLRAALIDTATPVSGPDGALSDTSAQGGGSPDLTAADSMPILAAQPTLSFGVVRPGVAVVRSLGLENVSGGVVAISLEFVPDARSVAAGVTVASSVSSQLQVKPGDAAPVQITLTAATAPQAPTALGGWLVLHLTAVDGTVRDVRIPLAAAIGDSRQALIRAASIDVVGAGTKQRPKTSLTIDVGGISERDTVAGATLDVQSVSSLTVELRRLHGRSLGVIYAARDLLPGRIVFSLAARQANGKPLARGTYRLVVRAHANDGREQIRRLPFRVR